MIDELGINAKQLLIDLINTPSFSGEEDQTERKGLSAGYRRLRESRGLDRAPSAATAL